MTLCTSWILLLLLRWYPQNLGLIASSSTKSYWSRSLIFYFSKEGLFLQINFCLAMCNAFEFIFVNWGNLARKWHSGWKSLKKYDFSTLTSMLVLKMDQLYYTLVLLMDMLKLSNFVIHIFGAKIQMRHFFFQTLWMGEMTSKRRHRGLEFRTIAKSLLQNIINPDKRGPNLDLKGLLLPYNRTCLHQLWWCWCQCLCLASFCRLHKMVFVLCLKGFSSVSIPSSQGYLQWRQQDLLLRSCCLDTLSSPHLFPWISSQKTRQKTI